MLPFLILAFVGPILTGALGWWLGYHAGNDDGVCSVRQAFPWLTPEQLDQ